MVGFKCRGSWQSSQKVLKLLNFEFFESQPLNLTNKLYVWALTVVIQMIKEGPHTGAYRDVWDPLRLTARPHALVSVRNGCRVDHSARDLRFDYVHVSLHSLKLNKNRICRRQSSHSRAGSEGPGECARPTHESSLQRTIAKI